MLLVSCAPNDKNKMIVMAEGTGREALLPVRVLGATVLSFVNRTLFADFDDDDIIN